MSHIRRGLCCVLLVGGWTAVAAAQQATMSLADGALQMSAPATWVPKQPATSIVEYEFSIPATKGDSQDGRMTVMAAGGSIDANMERWFAQFTQADGANTKERAKVSQKTVSGQDVRLVDISGTYKDSRGPMTPSVERPKYRMLAAIISTKGAGNYFIKFYGPEATVAANQEAFAGMIDGLKQK